MADTMPAPLTVEQLRAAYMAQPQWRVTLNCGHIKQMRRASAPHFGEQFPCWSSCDWAHTRTPVHRHATIVQQIDDGQPVT